MDYPIANHKANKLKFWKEFHYLDIIPYSLAVTMLSGSVYIIMTAIEITRHRQ